MGHSDKKTNKETLELNGTIDRMDLTDRNKEESKSSWNLMKSKHSPLEPMRHSKGSAKGKVYSHQQYIKKRKQKYLK
jgi:hypothetical protein